MPIELIYWDSCLFLYRFQRHPDHIAVLQSITDRAEKGEVQLVTSTFTLCEVVSIPGSTQLPAEQEKMIVEFFENPYILLVQVDRNVALRSRQITRDHPKVKPKDAVHIASAIEAQVSVMQTNDGDHLLPLDGKIGNPPLRIEKPKFAGGQPPLLAP